jgi:hypothetical protein
MLLQDELEQSSGLGRWFSQVAPRTYQELGQMLEQIRPS